MSSLDGAIHDGRHRMQIRVYYEDTDFGGSVQFLADPRLFPADTSEKMCAKSAFATWPLKGSRLMKAG